MVISHALTTAEDKVALNLLTKDYLGAKWRVFINKIAPAGQAVFVNDDMERATLVATWIVGWSRWLTKSLACSIIFRGHHLMGSRIISLYCTRRLALFANEVSKNSSNTFHNHLLLGIEV